MASEAPVIQAPQVSSVFGSGALFAQLALGHGSDLKLPIFQLPEPEPEEGDDDEYKYTIWAHEMPEDEPEWIPDDGELPPEEPEQGPSRSLANLAPVLPPPGPLQDSYPCFFPGFSFPAGVGRDNPWLRPYSARVTASASCILSGPANYKGKARLRLALGCEDGAIRIFSGEDDEELARAMEASEDAEPDSPLSAVTFDAARTPHSSPRRGDREPANSRPPLSPGSPTRSLMRLGIGSPNGGASAGRDRSTSMASTSTARSKALFSLPAPARPSASRRPSSSASSTATMSVIDDEDHHRANKAAATVSVSDFDAEGVMPTSPSSSSSKARGRHQRNKPSISVSALNAVTVPSSRPMLENLRRISSSSPLPSPPAPSSGKPSPTQPRPPAVALDKAWSSTTSLTSQPSPPPERRFSLNGIDERPSLDLLLSSSDAVSDPWSSVRLRHLVDALPREYSGPVVAMEVLEGAVEPTEADEDVPDGKAMVCLTEEGILSKMSIIDGHCFASVNLAGQEDGKPVFTGFSVVAVPSDAFVLCFAPTAGLCVPVRLSDFSTLLPLSFPTTTEHMTLVEHFDGHGILLVSSDGVVSLASVILSDEAVSVGDPRVISDEFKDTGCEGAISDGTYVALWTDTGLHVWDLTSGAVTRRVHVNTAEQIRGVRFCSSRMISVLFEGSVAMYETDNASRLVLRSVYDAEGTEFVAPVGASLPEVRVLLSARSGDRPRRLEVTGISVFDDDSPRQGPPHRRKPTTMLGRTVFAVEAPKDEPGPVHVTATKLLDDTSLLVGDSCGGVSSLSLGRSGRWELQHIAANCLEGAVLGLWVHADVVFVATAAGHFAAFTHELTDPRTAFISYSAVCGLAHIDEMGREGSEFANTFLCLAQCGDVYFFKVAPTTLDQVAVFETPSGPARDLWLDGERLLVAYDGEIAVERDFKEGYVQKDMTAAAAYVAAASTPTWIQVSFITDRPVGVSVGGVSAAQISLRKLGEEAADFRRSSKQALPLARLLLCRALAGSNLPQATLADLREHLGIKPSKRGGLIADCLSSTTLGSLAPSLAFTLSQRTTSSRLLILTILLRAFLNDAPSERHASQAIVALTMLPETVGPTFKSPSLDVFAEFWLDQSHEIREAARMLFGASLSRLSDRQVRSLGEKWQSSLPASTPCRATASQQAHALLVVGLVTAERYKLLSSSLLKDLATSVETSLSADSSPTLQAVAVELCCRSFSILQHFIDAMSVMRTLFGLATGRDARTSNELRTMAKHAVLQVASVNTPLFMTTLSYDLVSASEASHRIATMKLVAFMVRKKPRILHTSLPRLAEAVVKSLDPTHKVLRDATQSAATVILHELVKTYPSIAFHGKTQRLAVGTPEGAVIVYDVKTATRLYVLGGHKRAVTACSFSPDGHRLVSVSLEEGRAEVWKVGAGVLGYLTPGAPPRQGGLASLIGGSNTGPTTPFKTFPFNVGEEGNMSTAATLEWVVIEWPAERSCRLKIRESALTFAV